MIDLVGLDRADEPFAGFGWYVKLGELRNRGELSRTEEESAMASIELQASAGTIYWVEVSPLVDDRPIDHDFTIRVRTAAAR